MTTIGCECGYTTDIELIDQNLPRHCPDCGGALMISGQGDLTDIPLYDSAGDLNPVLFEDD